MTLTSYYIKFKEDTGKKIKYKVCSKVRDEGHLMHEYFSHYVKYPTDRLSLEIEIPKDIIENVHFQLYADKDMEIPYTDKRKVIELKHFSDETIEKYSVDIEFPILFYTYSLEWKFKQ